MGEEGLEEVRETAGGVGERLRWAQPSPERGVGSPEARNTHTHTDTFHCISQLSCAIISLPVFPPNPPLYR